MSNIYERLFQNGLIEGLAKHGFKLAEIHIKADFENLNDWTWYDIETSTNSYTEPLNVLTLRTRENKYERLAFVINARANTAYKFEFELCAPRGYSIRGGVEQITCAYIASELSPPEYITRDMMIAWTNNFYTNADTIYRHYECEYVANKNMPLYFMFNFSNVIDKSYDYFTFNIRNLKYIETPFVAPVIPSDMTKWKNYVSTVDKTHGFVVTYDASTNTNHIYVDSMNLARLLYYGFKIDTNKNYRYSFTFYGEAYKDIFFTDASEDELKYESFSKINRFGVNVVNSSKTPVTVTGSIMAGQAKTANIFIAYGSYSGGISQDGYFKDFVIEEF